MTKKSKETPKEKPKEDPKESSEKKPETVRVRVKKDIVKYGGGFHDFHSGIDLYPKSHKKIFTVPITPFIKKKIATGELILVVNKA